MTKSYTQMNYEELKKELKGKYISHDTLGGDLGTGWVIGFLDPLKVEHLTGKSGTWLLVQQENPVHSTREVEQIYSKMNKINVISTTKQRPKLSKECVEVLKDNGKNHNWELFI